MGWRALVSQGGCHVVYLTDDFGRLLGIWATEKPEDFHWNGAHLVAALARADL